MHGYIHKEACSNFLALLSQLGILSFGWYFLNQFFGNFPNQWVVFYIPKPTEFFRLRGSSIQILIRVDVNPESIKEVSEGSITEMKHIPT